MKRPKRRGWVGVLFTPLTGLRKIKGRSRVDFLSRVGSMKSQVQGKQLISSLPLLSFGPFISIHPPMIKGGNLPCLLWSKGGRVEVGDGGRVRGGALWEGVQQKEEEGRVVGHLADELNL